MLEKPDLIAKLCDGTIMLTMYADALYDSGQGFCISLVISVHIFLRITASDLYILGIVQYVF